MSLNINKALLVLALAAPAAGAEPIRRARYVMGTVCEITAYTDTEAVTAAFAELERWDRILSLYKEDSELSGLNRAAGKPVKVSPDLWAALEAGLKYAQESGGAFDPTILPVLRGGSKDLVDYRKVDMNPFSRTVRMPEGMGITLDGIGKGIALDRAAEVLRLRGVRAARLNHGGQIYALGAPPAAEGWVIELESGGSVMLRDQSASTAGNSQQPGHIRSPFTGERILEDRSVTVVARTATEADGRDTGLFVAGRRGLFIYP